MALRKLQSGSEKVDNIYETAATVGCDVIECVWSKKLYNKKPVYGYVVPVISEGESYSEDVDLSFNAKWVSKKVVFYPDGKNVGWGYIYDDPEGKNRDMLANQLSTNWFKPVDPRVKADLIKLAEDKGIPTEPAKKVNMVIKTTKRERDLQQETDNLRKRMKQMEEDLKRKEASLSDKKDKRLKGVKIESRDEKLKENTFNKVKKTEDKEVTKDADI